MILINIVVNWWEVGGSSLGAIFSMIEYHREILLNVLKLKSSWHKPNCPRDYD